MPELGCCLCLLLSLSHYPFLCKQVWDGAHPVWDAFTGLCVYIKLSSTMSNKVRKKLKIKLKTKEGGRVDLRGLGPPWKKKVGFEALARAKICMPARTQTQRLTGLNCLPLCVAVLGAPHVICDHAAAAAPVAGAVM